MEECGEFGIGVDRTEVNVNSATIVYVDVERNIAEDVECHKDRSSSKFLSCGCLGLNC